VINATRRVPALVLAAGVFAVGLRGCSDEEESTAPSPTLDAQSEEAGMDVKVEGPAYDAGDTDSKKPDAALACPTTSNPEDVPPGWVRVPVFGCQYPIYAPPDPSMLPPGLSWEECTDIGPDPYTCTQVVVDWPNPNPIGGIPVGHVMPDGKVLLGLRKVQSFTESSVKMFSHMDLLVEADGPVRQAFWISKQSNSNAPFWFQPSSISDKRSTWHALELLDGNFVRAVNLGGPSADLIPPVVTDTPAEGVGAAGMSFTGENFLALRESSLQMRSWDGKDFGKVYQGLDIGNPAWVGDSAVWSANTVAIGQIWAWTEAKGAFPLISFGDDDYTRGVANSFTDGVDLVWLQGEERDIQVSEFYPERSIMTAKFTTDPSALQPKRLRSWEWEHIWGDYRPDAVGCGYAALQSASKNLVSELLIVRVSDGVSWALQSPADKHWVWGKPVAVTCDEVYVTWGTLGINHLRRVRLSSLGPGMPPD
jgi:hypothetical protein